MRKRLWWLIGLLTAGLALVPAGRAQEVPPAEPICHWPVFPIYSSPGEGCYVSGEYVMFHQKNPLKHQGIAFTGFIDADGSITGRVGSIVGNRQQVLFADDAGGPGTWQPGFNVSVGYRWRDGTTVDISWLHLWKAQYAHTETLARPLFQSGQLLQNSFLTSPVFNFPVLFAGPANDTGRGNPGATFGIWNAADEMNIVFEQRADQYDATFRFPVHETENWRCYGLLGPRFFWIWERFKWRTVDQDVNGAAGPLDQAIYTNIVSNRMYGPHIGWGNEVWLGNGFAATLDLGAALFLNIVKERARYEIGIEDLMANKRAIREWCLVPELTAKANLYWYPMAGVQLRLGYNFFSFFNTVAAPNPVSFNYGSLDPAWEKVSRWFHGFNVGGAIIF